MVGMAVATGPEASSDEKPARSSTAQQPLTAEVRPSASPYRADRRAPSRSAKRVTLQAKPKIKDHEYRTANLNLWPTPREKGKPLTVLAEGGKVAVTGVRKSGFAQILHDGQIRWVNDRYLAEKKPAPPEPATTDSSDSTGSSSAPAGLSSAPCPDGSSTESGLTSSAVRLYRSACAAFPELSSYGGYDGHGEHSSGRAIDFMVTDPALGQAVAEWARANASELGIFDIIWAQRIWTPVRASEGWRSMSDRGSSTANHYDHVHIAVN